MTADHGQQVVEIVRDSTGKLPYRVHFLRVMKLTLELLADRDVLVLDRQ